MRLFRWRFVAAVLWLFLVVLWLLFGPGYLSLILSGSVDIRGALFAEDSSLPVAGWARGEDAVIVLRLLAAVHCWD